MLITDKRGTRRGVPGIDYPDPAYTGITYVVPCSGKKLDRGAPAREMYRGSMFRHTYDNAVRAVHHDEAAGLGPARVLILSALYGLIDPETVVEPYDQEMGKPGAVTPKTLVEQAQDLGIDWGAQVYSLLPKAYFAQLDRALRQIYVYVQDVYEACTSIFDQRHTNVIVGRPIMHPRMPKGDGPIVWAGAGVHAFWWGEPILVSYGRLREVKGTLPVSASPWVLDSRGFNEIADHGRWTIPADEYAADVRRYAVEIGHLAWVAPQDWPAAAHLLERTGLTEVEHQRRTCESVVELRRMLPDLNVIAVVTAKDVAGYLRHKRMYLDEFGIDLERETIPVGVGALVRRPVKEAAAIIRLLHEAGVPKLHGFGIKTKVLDLVGHLLYSVDSACWSTEARRRGGKCPHNLVEWERNCPRAAREWCDAQRARAVAAGEGGQLTISDGVQVSLWTNDLF